MNTSKSGAVALSSILGLLGACGGGGGGGGAAPPPSGGTPAPAPAPAPAPVPAPSPSPAPSPAPAPSGSPAERLIIPFSPGKRWIYDADILNTVVSSTSGVQQQHFIGDRILYVDRQLQWQGRTAWRLAQLDFESNPESRIGLTLNTIHLAEGSEGLDRWVDTDSGGEWRRVYSSRDASFTNTAFVLSDGPGRQNRTELTGNVSVTVPQGTYQAVRASHSYLLSGGDEDIFEDRSEYFVDNVGVVGAAWNFSFDDNDPSVSDTESVGSVRLEGIDSGAAFVTELEPNDDARETASQPYAAGAFLGGDAQASDPGRIVVDANVAPNRAGLQLLQDWYRLSIDAAGQRRIALAYATWSTAVQAHSDLDLYLFREGVGGTLTFVARSVLDPTTSAGRDGEWVTVNLTPGNYYVAVQAWETPEATPYWLHVR